MVHAEDDPEDRVDGQRVRTSGRGRMMPPKVSANRRLCALGRYRRVAPSDRDDATTSGARGTPPRVMRCYQSPPHHDSTGGSA